MATGLRSRVYAIAAGGVILSSELFYFWRPIVTAATHACPPVPSPDRQAPRVMSRLCGPLAPTTLIDATQLAVRTASNRSVGHGARL